MATYLEITSKNASWRVLASEIAHNRATYFAEKEGMHVYKEEYHYCLNSDDEIMDWYLNNMNPEDLKWISDGISLLPSVSDDLEIDVVTI